MPEILDLSAAQVRIGIGFIKGKQLFITLAPETEGPQGLLFWEEALVLVVTGGNVFYCPTAPSAALTKAVAAIEPEAPHIRCNPKQFDFIVGSLLTKVGLPLTKGV